MTTYFTSDQHIGHANIIRYCDRPVSDLDDMDQMLISRWNETVSAEDEVWVLGDYAMKDYARGLSLLPQLNGTKYLVIGNHERCSPTQRDGHLHLPAYLEAGFTVAVTQAETYLPPVTPDGEELRVLLSHYPYSGESHSQQDRHERFRYRDLGHPLLCGHVHTEWQTQLTPRGSVQVNVGVDQWDFRPVSAAEVHRTILAAAPDDSAVS
ncbi:metallophosphoesterase [Nesterenkonia sphaerica]|uniref:Metallophosphoesterase n=1 Tax=Nesterenkonia sphaerica TaxID=1804988 RepID=A0A5R9AM21_9MICC|nr:metallophosphoesterase [Nesterenkonia sphaerica]TLP79460.1 metallophosphoesterase [Nesterenkonia sphaerica]